MKRAVIYARFSSHKQQETSIEGQIKVCEDYACREGLEIVDTYIDRAISGTTDKRPGFNRMIADSGSGNFEYIIVYKLDRFARNRLDSAIYRNLLKNNGVKLKSAMEPISEAPEGILLEGMLESYNEYYSKELSQKTKRGMTINAEKANSNGGAIPYGYKIEDKKYVIDDEAAEIVKEIFNMYADGKTKAQIIDDINSRKIPHNKKFSHGTLTSLLKNKKYIGIYHFNEIEIEDGCPAIIDRDMFENVQEILKKSIKTFGPKKSPADYLLSGKLICGECGSPMQGESARSRNGSTIYYYVCRERKKNKTCSKKRERKEDVEDCVINATLDYVLNPENAEDIVNQMMLAVNYNSDAENIKKIERNITRLNSKINNNLESISDIDNRDLRKKLLSKTAEYESEKTELEKTLEKLKKYQGNEITPDKIRDWIFSYKKYNPSDSSHRKKIIDTFIHSVVIYDNKIAIYYKFNNGIPLINNETVDFKNKKESRSNGSTSLCIGSPSWTRTNDPAVNSRMLYRLSY